MTMRMTWLTIVVLLPLLLSGCQAPISNNLNSESLPYSADSGTVSNVNADTGVSSFDTEPADDDYLNVYGLSTLRTLYELYHSTKDEASLNAYFDSHPDLARECNLANTPVNHPAQKLKTYFSYSHIPIPMLEEHTFSIRLNYFYQNGTPGFDIMYENLKTGGRINLTTAFQDGKLKQNDGGRLWKTPQIMETEVNGIPLTLYEGPKGYSFELVGFLNCSDGRGYRVSIDVISTVEAAVEQLSSLRMTTISELMTETTNEAK